MEEKNNLIKNTKLTLLNQNMLSLTGISKVISNTETNICVIINNQTTNIEGDKLTIKKLDIENGILEAEGTITAIKYSHTKQKENFIKRIFG